MNLRYARFVVSQIIGEPFRAVAPAAGADVVVVTRWALAALRRRAWRDAALTGLLATGLVASIWDWTWIPVAVVAALAISVVAYEQWVRDVKVLARLMLRGRFRARHAPSSRSQRVEDRLAVVQQQQNGNLVVFRGRSAFIGSGQKVVHDRIVVNVALGKKGKGGKRQKPVPFSTLNLHQALETALKPWLSLNCGSGSSCTSTASTSLLISGSFPSHSGRLRPMPRLSCLPRAACIRPPKP